MIKNDNQQTEITVPEHKICDICKIDKPKNEFGPSKEKSEGFECFECRKKNYYANEIGVDQR